MTPVEAALALLAAIWLAELLLLSALAVVHVWHRVRIEHSMLDRLDDLEFEVSDEFWRAGVEAQKETWLPPSTKEDA